MEEREDDLRLKEFRKRTFLFFFFLIHILAQSIVRDVWLQ